MTPHEESLTDIVKKAWLGRVHILAGMIAGLILAAFLSWSLTPVYEASMIITPLSQSSEERSVAILNDSAASLREMFVSTQIPRDYIKFQQVFREISAARVLAAYKDVLPGVNRDRFFVFGGGPGVKTPSGLSDYIKKNVTIRQIGPTSSQLVVYRHPDPAFAEKFLGRLHKVADEMIRNEARTQSEKRISYLRTSLQESYNPEHRKALADLLLLEERQKMFISMDHPFAAEILESPAASSKPVWPKACIVFPLCILLGAFFGFLNFSFRRAGPP